MGADSHKQKDKAMRYQSLVPLMRWLVYFYIAYYIITHFFTIYEKVF